MKFVSILFMLLAVGSAVFAPYFVGHGIVSEHGWPWVVAAVLAVLAVVFGFVYVKLADRVEEPDAHASGH